MERSSWILCWRGLELVTLYGSPNDNERLQLWFTVTDVLQSFDRHLDNVQRKLLGALAGDFGDAVAVPPSLSVRLDESEDVETLGWLSGLRVGIYSLTESRYATSGGNHLRRGGGMRRDAES